MCQNDAGIPARRSGSPGSGPAWAAHGGLAAAAGDGATPDAAALYEAPAAAAAGSQGWPHAAVTLPWHAAWRRPTGRSRKTPCRYTHPLQWLVFRGMGDMTCRLGGIFPACNEFAMRGAGGRDLESDEKWSMPPAPRLLQSWSAAALDDDVMA